MRVLLSKYGEIAFLFAILIIISSCNEEKKNSQQEPETKSKTIEISDSIPTSPLDSVVIQKDTSWMGPLLLVNDHEVAILKTNYQFGDTIPLTENIIWVKNYLNSDTILSLGRNGVQKQQITGASISNPGGDCNNQVVLKLEKDETRGFLVGSNFLKNDSIQFFDHREKEKLYFSRNQKAQSFYDSIFGLYTDTLTYDQHSYHIVGSENFIVEKRGISFRMYNEELYEEHFLNYNEEYRVAIKKNGNWSISQWTPCLEDANSPKPQMCAFSENEILVVWGFSEGMGDYQIYVSRIGLSDAIPTFQNGKKMQGYISMGCD